jgi:WD40 repeat protein
MPRETRARRAAGRAALLAAALLLAAAQSANAAGAPVLGKAWSSAVFTTTARLHAEVNPNGLSSGYHFDYITRAAYEANVAASKDPFAGALRSPPVSDANLGSGTSTLTVLQILSGLSPDTAYRYRVVAKNSAGTVKTEPPLEFRTFPPPTGVLLPDGRGWEMVSPVQKNGGQVDLPETLAAGGLLQAAAQGGGVTYSSAASFAEGGQGAPIASQYLAGRLAGGWSTQNITTPLFAGTYDTETEGAPYRLFSEDLARGLMMSGKRCRGEEASGCPVANPPPAGTDAPAGYRNYYLRESASTGFEALLGSSDVASLQTDPADFDLAIAGASPDLKHVVLSTCAGLSANASEVPAGEGCDEAKPNLYRWSNGSLALVNLLPAQSNGTPGAKLAALSGAVSADGNRVYFTDLETGNLYLREGTATKQVDAAAGGGGSFEAASQDGTVAYFSKAGHLWRYLASTDSATDLTPSGGVVGVLGAAADGSRAYFQDGSGLKSWAAGTTSTVAPGASTADTGTWPPATGSARVSADGSKLLFTSTQSLTGYDNTDLATKAPDRQVFLYDSTKAALACLSCNPAGQRPIGASSVPGARKNGSTTGSPIYKPRVMVANGQRVFFESADALVLTDTNSDLDVYQWEAQGTGSCNRAGGCLALISSGRATGETSFADASADGSDAFFITEESLVGEDPGSLDLYDARVGGGFAVRSAPIPCSGDNCQILPPEPTDPTLTTLLSGPGNPSVRYRKYGRARKECPQGKRPKTVTKKGKKVTRCVRVRKLRTKRGGR